MSDNKLGVKIVHEIERESQSLGGVCCELLSITRSVPLETSSKSPEGVSSSDEGVCDVLGASSNSKEGIL